MTGVRLLADDLTGALDTAAELVGVSGPVHAFWHGALPIPLPRNAAIDSGTRELQVGDAVSVTTALAPALVDADIAFKKVDSLMRGPTLAEVAACVRAGKWERAIMAPAFPYQGRVTRGGVQHASDGQGGWRPIGGDIIARLRQQSVQAQKGRLEAELPSGISVFDAETDADLQQIAAFGRAMGGSVLWVGTGGLAHALAGLNAAEATTKLPRPLLGLSGSDQEVTASQLLACGPDWLRLRDGAPTQAAKLLARLQTNGRVMASFILPEGTTRHAAAERIGAELDRLAQALPPPGTLIVAGGETLRALCLSLGASSLELQGRIVPGLPRSVMRGGRWDGVTVVSKSGAFGTPTLLRDILHNMLTTEKAA